MAISDYSTTAASNTSLSGIDISGTTGKVKDGDNAIRQLMADIKAGVPYLSGSNYLIESTDAGASAGPVFELYRNSASPAASDILGKVLFNGEDSAGNTQEYASVETVIVDATSTSEDGQLDFYVTKAGTRTKFASMTATATAFTGAAGYTFDAVVKPASNDVAALGVSGTAFSDLFLASGAVIDFAAGNVVLTHTSGILSVSTGDLKVTTPGSAASSVVTVGGTQTLTNKTLTSPTLTAPDIGSATGSTLSIATFSATGASAGLQIDNAGRINASGTGTGTTTRAAWYNANGQVGNINTSGTSTGYATSSDERLKENFRAFDSGAILDAINIYEFDWRLDGTSSFGAKAQELYAVVPQAVYRGSEADPGQENFEPWGVDYSKLVPILVRELKEVRSRLAALETSEVA